MLFAEWVCKKVQAKRFDVNNDKKNYFAKFFKYASLTASIPPSI